MPGYRLRLHPAPGLDLSQPLVARLGNRQGLARGDAVELVGNGGTDAPSDLLRLLLDLLPNVAALRARCPIQRRETGGRRRNQNATQPAR